MSSLIGLIWGVIYFDLGFTEICLCIAATEVNGWETSQVFSWAWKSVVKLLASVCQSYSRYISPPPQIHLPSLSFCTKDSSKHTQTQTHTASARHGSHPERGSSVAPFQRALCLLSFWCSLASSSGADMPSVRLWYEFVPDSPHCSETLKLHSWNRRPEVALMIL